MKVSFALLLLSLFSSLSYGATEHYYGKKFFNDYLQSHLTKTGEELKKDLYVILSSYHESTPNKFDEIGTCTGSSSSCYRHSPIGYSKAREVVYKQLDVLNDSRGYYVRDVYCAKEVTLGRVLTNLTMPNANDFNIEHTWPQSRFSPQFDKDTQKCDMHHLFPTENHINSMRGNYEFGEISPEEDELDRPDCKISSLGYSSAARETIFTPPADHRGNVARALFYFSVRYKVSLSHEEETTLKKWHINDPVDAKEKTRNELVFKNQKNRNPFIDYPILVQLIGDF